MSALVQALEAAAKRRAPAAAAAGAPDSAARLAAVLSALRTDYPVPRRGKRDPADQDADPVAGIRAVFGLDEVDASLLWLAAAPEFDANVGLAYGLLRGAQQATRASVGLALELAGIATGDPAGWIRLGPPGALQRHQLIDISGAEPWVHRDVRVPDPVAAVLAGASAADPSIARLRTVAVPLDLPGRDVLARAIEQGEPLVWVRSVQGAAGLSLAAGAFAAVGIAPLAIDLRLHGAETGLSEVVSAAAREAGLHGWGLIVAGADVLAERHDATAFEALQNAAVPVVAVGAKSWNPSWLRRLPLMMEAQRLSVPDRATVWQANLGEFADQDSELRQTLLGLRMTPESVTEAARYARVLASVRNVGVSSAIVRESARRVSGSGTSAGEGLAKPATSGPRLGFEDLLLPDSAASSVRQLVHWARHRDELMAQGTLRRSGRGIAALFAGNPGTGKTLAANVVAEELSLDLFQVEISAVVDKYIGETEKNLERVFQAAEALDVVLFFDEADALFGSRSEVKDARDRYANQEVAYLLQRMESFDGITILATNLRGNLDRAFSRRMSFIIHFPDPDPPIRRRLWQHHLDQLDGTDPADPLALDFLAQVAEVTGGDIRNMVLAAAYDAISVGEKVGMRHVSEAAVREYRKLGRVVPEHRFVPPGS
jgi:hypothetical protein